MISISITAEAYQAIKATLPEVAGSWPTQTDERGLIRIWLDRPFVDRLGQMRGPGESYSDVILRLAKADLRGRPSDDKQAFASLGGLQNLELVFGQMPVDGSPTMS
jgi:hypothetical protein